MSVIRTLIAGMIDYAGLFPPAALDMKTVVRNYALYADGEESWALGRLIVPVGRLPEFTDAFNEVCCDEREKAWLLSVLGSNDLIDNETRITEFTQGAALIDTIELKAEESAQVERLLSELPESLTAYIEFSPEKTSEMLPVLAGHGFARAPWPASTGKDPHGWTDIRFVSPVSDGCSIHDRLRRCSGSVQGDSGVASSCARDSPVDV